MSHHRRRFVFGVLLAVAGLLHRDAATAQEGPFIYTVGAGTRSDNCSFKTIQEAINAAKARPGPDIIYITKWVSPGDFGGVWSDLALQIDSQDLEVIGGMTSCWDSPPTDPAQKTVLSGRGGAPESILQVRGGGVVTLRNLEFVEGDEDDSSNGGGVDYAGRGVLNLEAVRFFSNRAGYGGGLYFTSSGGPAVLGLGNHVEFVQNFATDNGGAMHVSGDTRMYMNSFDNHVSSNSAIGRGGGLYLRAPARATVSATSPPGLMLFSANAADKGGAIALNGNYSDNASGNFHLFANEQTHTVPRVGYNVARTSGGAIYMTPTYVSGSGPSSVTAYLSSGEFSHNRAPKGAAVYAATDVSLGRRSPQIWYISPFGFLRGCVAPPCVRFFDNSAWNLDLTPSGGAVVEADVNSAPDELNFFYAAEGQGEVGALFRFEDTANGRRPTFKNCLIDSRSTHYAIDAGNAPIEIRHCTLLHRAAGQANPRPMLHLHGESLISNTILAADPGLVLLDPEGATTGFRIDHVLASDIATLPAGAAVLQGDPGFVDPNDLDVVRGFGLTTGSLAIDLGPELGDGITVDLARRPRTVDLWHPNTDGPRDAGALELQSSEPPPVVPEIFASGFEAAPSKTLSWCRVGAPGCSFPWMNQKISLETDAELIQP